MPPYQLGSLTVDDAAGLAKSNVTAFYEETWWRILFPPTRTRESLIQAVTARSPRNLLTARDVRRHQKVVDSATGELVGYARWILPESLAHEWMEAQVPSVSEAYERRDEKMFDWQDFTRRNAMAKLAAPIHAGFRKFAPPKPHISESGLLPPHIAR